MNLMGFSITTELPEKPFLGKKLISTINPHSYIVAKKDIEFKEALSGSEILLPDGVGIVLAAQFLKGKKIKKIAGYDVFLDLMKKLDASNGSCFFLGSSDSTLEKIKNRIRVDFPNVDVRLHSPPFKPFFLESDNIEMVEKINEFKPDVLFVGMTAPKQEKWAYQHINQLEVKVVCSIGAVFDFYAGTKKRAPKWMIKAGLEWLHRSLISPGRLGRRNVVSNPRFLWDVLKLKFFGS